jgi:V/A-type H+/Na+-transporting ATPase subunit E
VGLHAILTEIRTSGDSRVQEIEQRVIDQATELLAQARREAEEMRRQACAQTAAPAAKERARITHRARLEALREVGNVREALVDAALEQTRGRLASLRTHTNYPTVLRRLIEEALSELHRSMSEVETICLQVDPRDRSLVDRILDDLGLRPKVNYELKSWGGLTAKSEDGRVVVINTLEARFERATPHLGRYLAAAFEEELSVADLDRVLEELEVN